MKKVLPKPFFSVVILAFNRPEGLERAINSVKKQNFKDYEILVVDASKCNWVKDLVEKNNFPIKYFRIKDAGIGKARDYGLKKAKGEWTAFLDDDDEYLPKHLETRYGIIQKNPKLELLYNGFKTIGPQYVPDLLSPGKFLHVDDPAIFHAGTAVVKTKEALEVGGFSTKFKNYPDNFYDVAKKAGLKMLRIVVPRTYIYHRDPDSYTGKLTEKYKK